MAWPGDEMAAAAGRGRGELRASHADREQVISTLRPRSCRACWPRTNSTSGWPGVRGADLRGASRADRRHPRRRGRHEPGRRRVAQHARPDDGEAARRSGICLLAAVALAEGAFLAGNLLLLVAATFALIAASGFFGYGILDAWQERRSGGQLPQRPDRVHQDLEGGLPGRDTALPGGRPDRPEPTCGLIAHGQADRTLPGGVRGHRAVYGRHRAPRNSPPSPLIFRSN